MGDKGEKEGLVNLFIFLLDALRKTFSIGVFFFWGGGLAICSASSEVYCVWGEKKIKRVQRS